MESMHCSLYDYIELRGGTLGEMEAAKVMLSVANSVNYMHDIGYVHFDLKPANILVNYEVPNSRNSNSSVSLEPSLK